MTKPTVAQFINHLAEQLMPACKNVDRAHQEAWWLVQAVSNKSKSFLLAQNSLDLGQQEQAHLDSLVAQRVHEHKPLQYLLGTVPFCGLTVKVSPPILIPRPETEEWVTWLIDQYKQAGITSLTALDLCTGTGCIGLALAYHFPHATVMGIDLNPKAVALANENKQINKVPNISFITSDLYAALPPAFSCHLIVSNPPYLSPEEYRNLEVEVTTWEDRNALVGGDDGMIFYRRIIQQARQFLRPLASANVPNMVLEIGPAQEEHLEQLLKELHISTYTIHKDLQGKNRWISLIVSI